MPALDLTAAFGDYDRTAPLRNGTVRPEGIDLRVLTLPPSEIFARMSRHLEFDVSEMSMGTHLNLLSTGDSPLVAIPAFPSKAFRHVMCYVNVDSGIERPEDLNGKRIAIQEWGMTAIVWIVGILTEEYGFDMNSVEWVAATQPRAAIRMPECAAFRYMTAEESLSELLEAGEVDVALIHQVPACFAAGSPRVRRLFDDVHSVELDYYRRTAIHPIMHCVVLRADVNAAAPWAARSLYTALAESRDHALARLHDFGAYGSTLPFLPTAVEEADAIFGSDLWAYGIESNRATLEPLMRYAHQQGLTDRLIGIEEAFSPAVQGDA
jgi:4,5-dihydroxyphthalate decarboxylase